MPNIAMSWDWSGESMVVYSFYDEKSGVKEALDDHVRLALDKLSNLGSSRLMRLESRDKGSFNRALSLAVILHDVGKAFFQRRNREGRMTFWGHELISAYVTNATFVNLSRGSPSHAMLCWRTPVAFSVLYHHHAMGRDLEQWGRKYPQFYGRWYEKRKSFLVETVKVVEDHLRESGLGFLIDPAIQVLESLSDIESPGDFVRKIVVGVNDLKNNIWKRFTFGSGDHIARERSLAMLSALITVDYLASNEKRGGGTRFLGVLKEFHSLYLQGAP
ncbi:MAG: hypothetical protein J7L91_05340 [Candidatus Korarchaeota archaeon]|nr:hypothetical protein [Candidatus Korarchaeota archaeon]